MHNDLGLARRLVPFLLASVYATMRLHLFPSCSFPSVTLVYLSVCFLVPTWWIAVQVRLVFFFLSFSRMTDNLY